VIRTFGFRARALGLGSAGQVLAALWAGLGAADVGYAFLLSTQRVTIPDDYGGGLSLGQPWSGVVFLAAGLALLIWLWLAVPVLVVGWHRLGWFRRGSRRRAVAWAAAWATGVTLAGLALLAQDVPPVTYLGPALVSWGELPVCAGFLVVGVVMTWILRRPGEREQRG
jgi:hypothetical protein